MKGLEEVLVRSEEVEEAASEEKKEEEHIERAHNAASFFFPSSPALPTAAAASHDHQENGATKNNNNNMPKVALKSGEPVMKILKSGEWVEHRYAEDWWGWTFLDVCAFEGRLYAVTTHGRIAEVDFAPGSDGEVINVELLESEAWEEMQETAWGVLEKMTYHLFDVVTDTDSHVLELAADARGTIRNVTVYW